MPDTNFDPLLSFGLEEDFNSNEPDPSDEAEMRSLAERSYEAGAWDA